MTFIGIRSSAVWCAVGLAAVGALALLSAGLMVFEDAFAESTLLMDTAVGVITIAASFILAFFFEDARRESGGGATGRAGAGERGGSTASSARKMYSGAPGWGSGTGSTRSPSSPTSSVLDELQQGLAGPDLVDALTDALDGALRIAVITATSRRAAWTSRRAWCGWTRRLGPPST